MAGYVIIDTDILIDAARGVREAIECLEQIESQSALSISVISQMELIVGCRNKDELRVLEEFLSRFYIISLNELIAIQAVTLLEQYRLSHGLLIADALISATAINVGFPLISKNQRDYQFIEELELLSYPNPVIR